MKKFLFTLVALLMAGTAVADDYLFIENIELTQEQATNGVTGQVIFLKAHFDAYVSTFDCDIQLPEGWELTAYTVPNSAKPYVYQYVDVEDDETGEITTQLVYQRMAPQVFREGSHFIMTTSLGAETDQCYNEDGSICYGAPKWGGDGVEFNMLRLVVNIPAGVTNTTITVVTEPSCTDDPRGNICPKNQHHEKVAEVTVEGGQEIQTPAPEIIVTPGENSFTFEAVGEGEITLYLDGVPVDNPYTVERTDVDQVIKLTAVAHVDGQTDGSVYGEYIVPALEVVEPIDLTGEIVISEPTEDGLVTITYTGDEDVTITVNGEEYTGEELQLVEGENTFVVVVTAEGYNDLTGEFTVTWTAPEPPQPEPTPMPEISYEVTDNAVIITATGEGEVILMVNGEPVENPYTIERGATDVVVTVTATAQAEGQLISDVATMEITIPAIGEEPQDPHATGVWVVFIQPDGQENWHAMTPGEGEPTPYNITLPLNKGIYGFPVDGVEPMVDFYLVVDGVTYGPEAYEELIEDEQFGNANMHQLYEGEEHFAVPSGYWYTIGIITDRHTGIKYMQISKGVFTDVNELNADKTVAGVRYFNMAGQEMQEANGMTIVVTTYTDGTTSAVKVMK